MDIKEFLAPTDSLVDFQASDKPRLLTDLSTLAASTLKLDADAIADALLKRESLGSTGVGGGVAVPHARIEGLQKPYGILARLHEPIEFDNPDGQDLTKVLASMWMEAPRPSRDEQKPHRDKMWVCDHSG